jgi:hypothetical protein
MKRYGWVYPEALNECGAFGLVKPQVGQLKDILLLASRGQT